MLMIKVTAVVYLIFSLVINAPAQSISDSVYFKKYTDLEAKKCPDCYLYLQLIEGMNFEKIRAVNKVAIRKVNENTFIIESRNLPGLSLSPKYLQYILPADNYWKLSPKLDKLRFSKDTLTVSRFTIVAKNEKAFNEILKSEQALLNGLFFLKEQLILSFVSTYKNVQDKLLHNKDVLFIDVETEQPRAELALPGLDFSVNKVNMVHNSYPSINGLGQNISIKEQSYDTNDIDLRGRLLASPASSAVVTTHANLIATIAAGGGNSVHYSKGVAWGAGISSSSFDNVLPDNNDYYTGNNIFVQNHSYGSAIDNSYGLVAMAFDKMANDNPGILHVFSAGNSGAATNVSGNYAGIPGYANLTGNYKMAKNVLLVGAIDSFGITPSFSSRGPAYDGRVKPDIVAFENNGTSESSAIVSGTALLLRQYFKEKYGGSLPSALAKAILINTAIDVNTPGPDYVTGFGNLNALKAMDVIRDSTFFSGTVAHGEIQHFVINVPPHVAKLKVSLVWNDTVGAAFDTKALINDLDLQVSSKITAQTWLPWVLSPVASKDSLAGLPLRKKDSLNNAEQVTIDDPPAGNYEVNISGYNIPEGAQKYYVVYEYDTAIDFQWQLPAGTDFFEAGKQSILRWETNLPGTGTIEYKNAANTWSVVARNVDLTKKYISWAVPDSISRTLLRMRTTVTDVYTDTFTIASILEPRVGFACADSILLYWNRLPSIGKYQVYRLGQKYMEPHLVVSDTTAILAVNSAGGKYFAVSPILNDGSVGVRSYAFDYTLQGTGCYIRAFLADQDSNIAKLSLSLGTLFRVSNISFEKLAAGGFISIYKTSIDNKFDFSFDFNPLTNGINIFRAKVTLQNGQILYSDQSSIYYSERGKYLVFPVPVTRNSNIEVFTAAPAGETFTIVDALGRTVLKKILNYSHTLINSSSIQHGIYWYRISGGNSIYATGKLLVL